MKLLSPCLLVFSLVFLPNATISRAQVPALQKLVLSVPDRANAILYLDTPVLRKLVDGDSIAKDLSERMGEVRIVADLDIGTLQPNWEVGVIDLSGVSNADSIAKSVGGYVDKIGSTAVVWSPRQAYLIPTSSSQLSMVRPADRKLASRYLKHSSDTDRSPYLVKEAQRSLSTISLLLAIDLEDVWSPIAIREKLSTIEATKSIDQDSLVRLLSDFKGIRLYVSKKDLTDCILSVDFASSPAVLLPIAKDFLAEVLGKSSASIPDVKKWTVGADGNTISFRGTITASTLDDLVGIFSLQNHSSESLVSESQSYETDSGVALKSKEYFGKVVDLVHRIRDYSASSTGDRARWNGRMANRIDEIPTLNVDPELVEFASRLASGFRGNTLEIQKTNVTYGTNSYVNSGYSVNSYGYGNGYGYYDVNTPGQYQAVSRGLNNVSFRETMSQAEQMIADMRRAMTEKYQIQF
ncbi:hypothetical protein SH449x_005148 [Pirellulaceae bacterium SH449]